MVISRSVGLNELSGIGIRVMPFLPLPLSVPPHDAVAIKSPRPYASNADFFFTAVPSPLFRFPPSGPISFGARAVGADGAGVREELVVDHPGIEDRVLRGPVLV